MTKGAVLIARRHLLLFYVCWYDWLNQVSFDVRL